MVLKVMPGLGYNHLGEPSKAVNFISRQTLRQNLTECPLFSITVSLVELSLPASVKAKTISSEILERFSQPRLVEHVFLRCFEKGMYLPLSKSLTGLHVVPTDGRHWGPQTGHRASDRKDPSPRRVY